MNTRYSFSQLHVDGFEMCSLQFCKSYTWRCGHTPVLGETVSTWRYRTRHFATSNKARIFSKLPSHNGTIHVARCLINYEDINFLIIFFDSELYPFNLRWCINHTYLLCHNTRRFICFGLIAAKTDGICYALFHFLQTCMGIEFITFVIGSTCDRGIYLSCYV